MRGQGEGIAKNIMEFMTVKTPVFLGGEMLENIRVDS